MIKKVFRLSILTVLLIACSISFKVLAQGPVQRAVLAGGDTIPAEDSVFKSLIPEIIYYQSDSMQLKGYLYKPKGKGPFPVYMWNHGSEKNPGYDKKLASFWLKNGYVFFNPIRSGHSHNPGEYICDREKQIRRTREMEQLQFRQIYLLHQKANKDVIAALQWIKYQPYADSNNIVVAGAGYGGVQVLLTAESSLGAKCFITMSPASTVWYKMWADSLIPAINRAKNPIFLLQAKNDYNLGPAEILGPVLEKKGFPNRYKIFPDHGSPDDHKQGHGDFFNDPKAWQKDVLKYLKDCGVRKK